MGKGVGDRVVFSRKSLGVEHRNFSPQLLLILATSILNNTPPIGYGSFSPGIVHSVTRGLNIPFLNNSLLVSGKDFRREVNLSIRKIIEKEKRLRDKQKKLANKGRVKHDFEVGDICVIKTLPSNNKFITPFDSGLFVVTEIRNHSIMLKRHSDDLTILRHPSQVRKVGKLSNSNFPRSLKPYLKVIGFSKSILEDSTSILDLEDEEEKITTRSKARENERRRMENVREDDDEFSFEKAYSREKPSRKKVTGKIPENNVTEDEESDSENNVTVDEESDSDSSDDDIVYYPDNVEKPKKHVRFSDKDEIRYFKKYLGFQLYTYHYRKQ